MMLPRANRLRLMCCVASVARQLPCCCSPAHCLQHYPQLTALELDFNDHCAWPPGVGVVGLPSSGHVMSMPVNIVHVMSLQTCRLISYRQPAVAAPLECDPSTMTVSKLRHHEQCHQGVRASLGPSTWIVSLTMP